MKMMRTCRLLAQTTLRNILGTKNLHEILSDRESISGSMQVLIKCHASIGAPRQARTHTYMHTHMLMHTCIAHLHARTWRHTFMQLHRCRPACMDARTQTLRTKFYEKYFRRPWMKPPSHGGSKLKELKCEPYVIILYYAKSNQVLKI